MTGAAESILRKLKGFGEPPIREPDACASSEQDLNAFRLMEMHSHWFGNAEDAGLAEKGGDAPRQDSPPAMLMTLAPAKPAEPPPPPAAETAVRAPSRQEAIAETLANAEKVLQTLQNLPPHSRLEASLTALQAALAGTSLDELEAALSGKTRNAGTGREG